MIKTFTMPNNLPDKDGIKFANFDLLAMFNDYKLYYKNLRKAFYILFTVAIGCYLMFHFTPLGEYNEVTGFLLGAPGIFCGGMVCMLLLVPIFSRIIIPIIFYCFLILNSIIKCILFFLGELAYYFTK